VNDLHTVDRALGAVVEEMLAAFPVVVLGGARQTGKTTLVQRLPSAFRRLYRTLDDLRVFDLATREPDLLAGEGEQMTLDEVQRAPDLLRAIKRLVDRDRRPGRFLLTGSANLLLMQTVSETLAGRAAYLHLAPLTESEKRDASALAWGALFAAASAEEAVKVARRLPLGRAWEEAACEGGYPPVLSLPQRQRPRWFESYVATYLERDLRQLADVGSLGDFRRLLEVAALRIGGIVNRAEIARDAGLSRPTAHRWLDLLEISYQSRFLQPYAVSRTRRLVKSPKLYWTDTGLGAYLSGILEPGELAATPRRGAFLENLVITQLDAWRETVAPRPELLYWRTADGQEVDLVVEHRRRLLPIEIKTASVVRAGDLTGLERFLDDYRTAHWGLVLHGGDDAYLAAPRIVAAPVRALL
jgi:predicted AAA+ superfamily ATPase